MKFYLYFFLMFCMLFFVCCRDDSDHNDENIDLEEFLSPVKDCIRYDYYDERHSVFYFLDKYFFDNSFEKEMEISLNDDFVLYESAGFFIYTRNKHKNYIWSSRCGVREQLTAKQLAIIENFINETKKYRRENKVTTGEFRFALYEWHGQSKKGKLETFYINHEPLSKADHLLYDYLATKVFIHGCKIHPLYRNEYAPKYNH